MDSVVEEDATWFNPVTFVFQMLASYGWYMLGASVVGAYAWSHARVHLDKWRQAREDAEYHKDPDKVLARLEAIQIARERQQQKLLLESQRAIELQKEREERKRAEAEESLRKYGTDGGNRLGTTMQGGDYLPLSGGASTSTYRPQKKSACGKGGCG